MNANLPEIVFWFSAAFIFYTYIGYPLLLFSLSKFKKFPTGKSQVKLSVSVVIAVRNEAGQIENRLKNLCAQDYPPEKMEVLVVSDGSDDNTDSLVELFSDKRVRLIKMKQSAGKAVAVNAGVAEASGEIIVFADARQTFDPNVLAELVANFSNPSVGCVGGELVFLDSPDSTVRAEMGAYWKYEKTIRYMESETGSVIGASGCIYTIRRKLYQPLPAGTILDDVLTPMNIMHQGYRVILEPAAIAYDIISNDAHQEWKRKVRTLTGNWQLLSLAPWLLLPWRNTMWLRFISHKLCRLCIPMALLLLLISGFICKGNFYIWSVAAQFAFYVTALLGMMAPKIRSKVKVIGLAYFFVLLNAAAVLGFWKWLHRGTTKVWGT
jgi:cellulose synthase/poly-beta-1,6-N-acetylglucosamine synthase-like glycosyltransferase